MNTATYNRPNYTAQDAASYKAAIDGAARVFERIAAAFAPHEQDQGSPAPEMSVRIDAGYIFASPTLTEVAAQTVSGFTTPSAGQERYDRVVIDATTGAATRVAGTASTGSPSAGLPAIPSGYMPCCYVKLTSADTVITNSMITDERAISAGAAAASGINAGARNAKMSVTSASASATFSADEILVETALGGSQLLLSSFSQTINLATTGAGGMDTGAAPASGFVSLYAIAKSDGTKNILACNVTTSSGAIYGGANMPSGYTYSALIGVWPTNGSSQFVQAILHDREIRYADVVIFTATTGNTSYTSQSISAAVPSVAKWASGTFGSSSAVGVRGVVVAADSGGVGAVRGLTANTGVVDSWTGPMQFKVPLITANTLYWKTEVADASAYRLSVSGYVF